MMLGARMTQKHRTTVRWVVLLLALCALAALDDSVGNATPTISEAYQKSFNQWKSELVAGRKKNWLTLSDFSGSKMARTTSVLMLQTQLFCRPAPLPRTPARLCC